SIVPISAKTGEGIPDLIILISLMAERRYLDDKLIDSGVTHGYILDLRTDPHYGKYYVTLHRYGQLRKGDEIIIAGNKNKVKHLLINGDNKELKSEHRFLRVDMIDRSMGIGLILEQSDPVDP